MRLCDDQADESPAHTSEDGRDRSIRTYFVQRCPACGRALRTPIHLLGKPVDCLHCRMQFVAHRHPTARPATADVHSAVSRADRLLARLAGQRSG